MFVFRFGKVVEYDEMYACDSWSDEQKMKAASFYATCIEYNIQTQEAYSLSFMYVTINSEPETDYSTVYKKKIHSILSRVEKA